MQVVIDIPDLDLKNGSITTANLLNAVRNGIPLPKGHGDLKDTEKLKNAFITWSMVVHGNFTDADIANIIYNSPTILEADQAEAEE